MTVLSVNVNKIAVLRNSRGGDEPNVVRAARACLDAGAHGITVHPRPDARHIRAEDVHALAELTRQYGVEFNLEGNPFAPPRPGYPGFLTLCEQVRPAQATLVPELAEGREGFLHLYDMQGGAAEATLKFILRDFELDGLAAKGDLLRQVCAAVAATEPRAAGRARLTEYRQWRTTHSPFDDSFQPAPLRPIADHHQR